MITDDLRSSEVIGIGAGTGSGGPHARPAERTKTWPRAVAHDDEILAALVAEDEASLWRLLADAYRAITRDDPIAHRYLLLLRFVLANSLALALVGAAAGQGWIARSWPPTAAAIRWRSSRCSRSACSGVASGWRSSAGH